MPIPACRHLLFLPLLVAGALASSQAIAAADDEPRAVYLSTGDNQDLLGLPLDSEATIDAVVDALQKRYRVGRVWWRGGQDEVWGREFVIRDENRPYGQLWRWWKHLAYEKVGTNAIAVRAAHRRGMEIWMAYGLFDSGSPPDVGFVGFPYAAEDKLRVDHPEWTPVNRYGTWRQGGPIEFCYPEARTVMIDYLAKHTAAGAYDGLAFLSYAENFSQRYEDEFGYNQPIVNEFKKRHGVDIRTQPFDRQAWSRLRGEYLTQFLRELRAAPAMRGRKIAVAVDGKAPHLPCIWNMAGGIRTAGPLHLDLETWVKEGLVDEIDLWVPNSDEAIREGLALCKGTRTTLSVFRTRGELPAGTPRLMWLGGDIESGFDWERYVDYPDEKLPVQPVEALKSDDAYARRRVLCAAAKGKQTLPLADIVAAVTDSDVFVRRLALRALIALKDPAAVPAVEAALRDPENSVRCQAALGLGRLAGPACVETLLAAAARPDSTFQFRFRAVPEVLQKLQTEGALDAGRKGFIASQLDSDEPGVREAALYYLQRVGAPATPAVERALLKILKDDASPHSREMALVNLSSSFGPTPGVLAAAQEAVGDKDAAVQVRAIGLRANLLRSSGSADNRALAIRELAAFVRRYGDACKRPDAAWGWREVGNRMLTFGAEGEKALRGFIEETHDRRLAELAWRVMYLRQGDTYYRITAEEDREAHAHHPFLSEGH